MSRSLRERTVARQRCDLKNTMRPQRYHSPGRPGVSHPLCLVLLQLMVLLTVAQVIEGETLFQRKTTLTPSSSLTGAVKTNSDSIYLQQNKSNVRRRPNNKEQTPTPAISLNKFENRSTVPGKAGIDYPTLNSIPTTSFTCSGRPPGYYADQESRCQVFHICYSTKGTAKQSFLCPNGTIFNQQLRICEWWTKLDCQNMNTSIHTIAKFNENNANDMMGSQSITKEIRFSQTNIPRELLKITQRKGNYLYGNGRHNSTESLTANEMKLLLDNVFTNFTDNKMNVKTDPVKRKINQVSTSKNIDQRRYVNRGTTTYRSNNSGSNKDKNVLSNQFRSINDQSLSSNNYDDMKTFIPLINNDRLTMIDKLIYGTGSKVENINPSSSGRNQVMFNNVSLEIVPSVTEGEVSTDKTVELNQFVNPFTYNPSSHFISNDLNKTTMSALLIQNLNTGFKHKATSNGIYRSPSTNTETANNSVIENGYDSKSATIPIRYGLYYSVNGHDSTKTEQHKPQIDNVSNNQFFLLDALSERFQKHNKNYNEDVRVRQNIVIPSVPKVSDVLSGLIHLNHRYSSINDQKTIDNNDKMIHQDISQSINISPKLLTNRSSNFNEQHTKNNKFNRKIIILNSTMTNEEIKNLFANLKELDKGKVRINSENTVNQYNQPQVQITQRPFYRSYNIGTGKTNRENVTMSQDYSNVAFATNRGFNNNMMLSHNKTLLGSTALYGIDLLASTLAINTNRNGNLTLNQTQNHKKPALTLHDIHTINQLQDGDIKDLIQQPQTRRELKHTTGIPQNVNHSYNVKPGFFKNVVQQLYSASGQTQRRPELEQNRSSGFSQYHADQKHDSVIVLPSLGFSLNTADDIKAFNHAISTGLLNEKR